MTKLQAQACHLIEQLPEEKLAEVVSLLYKLTANVKSYDELPAKQEMERQQRLKAFEDLRKAREKLIAMNIDWEAELKEALHEKYGV